MLGRDPDVMTALVGVPGRESDLKLIWGVGDMQPDPGPLTGVVGGGFSFHDLRL